MKADDRRRRARVLDYIARGAPFGPDDGTVAPWVVVASLPFAPEIVIPTVRNFARMDLGMTRQYGFRPSFNQTYPVEGSPTGWWVSPYQFGIDQGPVILMMENYRTGLLWNIMRRCPPSWRASGGQASPAAGCELGNLRACRLVQMSQSTGRSGPPA